LIKDILPDYNISDEILQNELKITDLLCHRAGMSSGDNLFLGMRFAPAIFHLSSLMNAYYHRHGEQHLDQPEECYGLSQ
jgi:hypothetical protein